MHQPDDSDTPTVRVSRRHERARRDAAGACAHCRCYDTEHDPRREGDGTCCDCGAINPAYATPESES